jgi:hypothetical protein
MLRNLFTIGVLFVATGQLLAEPPIEISYIGRAAWPGTAKDLSGLTDTLEDGSEHDRLGGLGSGIAWTGQGDRYVMISDRGAGDGAVSYRCRFHEVAIRINPDQPQPVTWEVVKTTLLSGPDREPLIGLASALPDATPGKPRRFDPEAIRFTRDNHVLITDEYGPSLTEFDLHGHWVRDWKLPDGFQVAHPAGEPEMELPPHNTSGRQANRGAEGFAITPDGQTMVILMQGPLIQDGALDESGKRRGKVVRLVTIDRTTGQATQYAYVLESAAYGLNEIEALNNHEFLVIERDGKGGEKAAFKRIARIDIAAATPLDSQTVFANGELPGSIRPVEKSWLMDLLDPRWGLAGKDFPEKTEGITLGPMLSDGRRSLLITSDNDFQSEVPTRVDVFALRGVSAP